MYPIGTFYYALTSPVPETTVSLPEYAVLQEGVFAYSEHVVGVQIAALMFANIVLCEAYSYFVVAVFKKSNC